MMPLCAKQVFQLATVTSRIHMPSSSRTIFNSFQPHLGSEQVGPAEALREQEHQQGDTDYNATPMYPNNNAKDVQGESMSASRSPHPSGPKDTSSVNDPAGSAEGIPQEQLKPQKDQGEEDGRHPHAMHVHHPGRTDDVAAEYSPSRSSGQSQEMSGIEASNVIPGSDRAMTADYAAGGDDINPPEFNPEDASLNTSTGLPQMDDSSGDAAGKGGGRFGQLKNPGEVRDEGYTARQTEKSTGMDPADSAAG